MLEDWIKKVRVGTSGFSFPDWAKTFYPAGLPRDLWLRYYSSIFNSLELNTTFYAIPERERIERMVVRLPENFEMLVKIPQNITHRHLSRREMKSELSKLDESLTPAFEKGIIVGYIAQFPESFKPSEHNREVLMDIIEFIRGQKFFEFRNILWQTDETLSILRENEIGWVIPDVPKIERLTQSQPIITCPYAYVRLHGRNKQNWYSSEKDRYDYLYSDDELTQIIELVKELSMRDTEKVFVFFNNCHMGKAARNAIKFCEMLGLHKPKKGLFDI